MLVCSFFHGPSLCGSAFLPQPPAPPSRVLSAFSIPIRLSVLLFSFRFCALTGEVALVCVDIGQHFSPMARRLQPIFSTFDPTRRFLEFRLWAPFLICRRDCGRVTFFPACLRFFEPSFFPVAPVPRLSFDSDSHFSLDYPVLPRSWLVSLTQAVSPPSIGVTRLPNLFFRDVW